MTRSQNRNPRSRLRVRVTRELGAAAVEASIAGALFFLVITSVFSLAWTSYTGLAMHFAISRAAREAITDPAIDVPSLQNKIQQIGQTLSITIDPADMHFCLPSQDPLCSTSIIPGSGGFFRITVARNIPFLFSAGHLQLTRSVLAKNEPY